MTRTLEMGMHGQDVLEVQQQLVACGYSIGCDGDFGQQTYETVVALQDWANVAMTGKVDHVTRDAIQRGIVARTSAAVNQAVDAAEAAHERPRDEFVEQGRDIGATVLETTFGVGVRMGPAGRRIGGEVGEAIAEDLWDVTHADSWEARLEAGGALVGAAAGAFVGQPMPFAGPLVVGAAGHEVGGQIGQDVGHWIDQWGNPTADPEYAVHVEPVHPVRVGHHETVERGHRDNADVADLQALLQARGFYYGPIDGDFGPATEQAVVDFQRSPGLGLNDDGIAGPDTWDALGG